MLNENNEYDRALVGCLTLIAVIAVLVIIMQGVGYIIDSMK